MDTTDKYHGAVRILHWIMAIGFAVLFVVGAVMTTFKKSEPWGMYELHKSIGILVFLLVWCRIIIRWRTFVPELPEHYPSLVRNLAHIISYVLYSFMLLVPVTGYAVSNINGFAVKFFGFPLPTLFPKIQELSEFAYATHYYAAYSFLAIIALHILGVIFHHLKSEDVLHRIT